MKTIDKVNTARAHFEGMLWAAYDVRIFSESVAEWQIETVKKYAKKLKEEEIEHSALTPAEKDEQNRLWKQWIDETTKGIKEVLKKEGIME